MAWPRIPKNSGRNPESGREKLPGVAGKNSRNIKDLQFFSDPGMLDGSGPFLGQYMTCKYSSANNNHVVLGGTNVTRQTLFGEYIFQLRRKKMLLQKQVALAANLDPSYLAAIENGRRDPPRKEVLEKLLDGLAAKSFERQRARELARVTRLTRLMAAEEGAVPGIEIARRLLECAPRLSILAPDFEVLVHDGENYAAEIQELQMAFGKALDFGGLPTVLPPLGSAQEVYENNIVRKTKARLHGRFAADKIALKEAELNQRTLREFLEHDSYFKRINDQAPTIHSRLMRLINGYEAHVLETRATWEGSPQQLTDKIREGLTDRISRELAPHIDETEAALIARLMVARWIAVCELDYE